MDSLLTNSACEWIQGMAGWELKRTKQNPESLNSFLWVLLWALCGVIHKKFMTSR